MTAHLLQTLLARGRAKRPLIGGHRGASARAPENTLAAFQAALDDGAEMIELDVHLTHDQRLAVIHDADTRRTTGYTAAVADLDSAALSKLSAPGRFSESWPADDSSIAIPLLEQVFALVDGRMSVNIEVKAGCEAIPLLISTIESSAMQEKVIISSFDPDVVAAVHAAQPELLTGLLVEKLPSDPVAAVRALGASLLHADYRVIDEALVNVLHKAKFGLVAWTVNEPAEMRRLAALGIEAILSDDPALLARNV